MYESYNWNSQELGSKNSSFDAESSRVFGE